MQIQITIQLTLDPGLDLASMLGSGEQDIIDEAKDEIRGLGVKVAEAACLAYGEMDDIPLDSRFELKEVKVGAISRG